MNLCFLTPLWLQHPLLLLLLHHLLFYIPLFYLFFLSLLKPLPLYIHCLLVPPLRLYQFWTQLHSPLSLLILTSNLRICVWSYLFHRWIFIQWPSGLRMVFLKERLTLPLYSLLLFLRLNPVPSRLLQPFQNGSLLCGRKLMLFMHKVLRIWCLSHLLRILLAVNGSTDSRSMRMVL